MRPFRRHPRTDPIGPASQRDVRDACEHLGEEPGVKLQPADLRYLGSELMEPTAFIDDVGWLDHGDDPSAAGWLLSYPQERWAQLLQEKHGRQLGHVVDAYKRGRVPPSVQVDGSMGDGRGRAVFFHGIGEKIPVARYTAVPRY